MKIIAPGTLPEDKAQWPIEFELICHHCRATFQIERGDAFEQFTEKRPDGLSTIHVACPVCASRLSFNRPSQTRPT